MGFFAEFMAWLNTVLLSYVNDNLVRVATSLRPAILGMGTLYVMIWGYLQMTGKIEEPFTAGLKRIATLVVIFGVALQGWLYNEVIVDTFFNAPGQLASHVVGAWDPVDLIDQILFKGSDIGERLMSQAGILDGNFGYYFVAILVYAAVAIAALYTMFLLVLSKIALTILLPLGPLFIPLMFFEPTERIFSAWLAQLCNYAMIVILTIMLAALMLTLLNASVDRALQSDAISIASAFRVFLTSVFALLVMGQVTSMAAGLASGVALTTHGAFYLAIGWLATRNRSRETRQQRVPNSGQGQSRLARGLSRLTERPNTVRSSSRSSRSGPSRATSFASSASTSSSAKATA